MIQCSLVDFRESNWSWSSAPHRSSHGFLVAYGANLERFAFSIVGLRWTGRIICFCPVITDLCHKLSSFIRLGFVAFAYLSSVYDLTRLDNCQILLLWSLGYCSLALFYCLACSLLANASHSRNVITLQNRHVQIDSLRH